MSDVQYSINKHELIYNERLNPAKVIVIIIFKILFNIKNPRANLNTHPSTFRFFSYTWPLYAMT